MPRLSLPKSALIRKPGEYRLIYAEGRRVRGDNFALVYRLVAPGAGARLGISVSGCKSAVRRNRIKRIVRELFRQSRHRLDPALELIFTVRRGFGLDSPAALAAALIRPLRGRVELAGLAAVAAGGADLAAAGAGPALGSVAC